MNNDLTGKFSNIYIMLLYAIMTNDIERVKHFLSDEMYLKYKNIIDEHIRNNETEMFDELNVYRIDIESSENKDNFEYVTVRLISRYMDYFIDNDTKKKKRGIDSYRIEKTNILVFKKSVSFNYEKNIHTCENCGANLDINFSGVCPYCNQSTDLKYKEYILIDLKTL